MFNLNCILRGILVSYWGCANAVHFFKNYTIAIAIAIAILYLSFIPTIHSFCVSRLLNLVARTFLFFSFGIVALFGRGSDCRHEMESEVVLSLECVHYISHSTKNVPISHIVTACCRCCCFCCYCYSYQIHRKK